MRKLIFAVITLLAVFNLISAYSGYKIDNSDQNVAKKGYTVEDIRSSIR